MACHQPTWISESARALKRRVLFHMPLHPGACSLKGGQQANDVAGHADLKDLFIVQDEATRFVNYTYVQLLIVIIDFCLQ